ncbi:synergin gamma-like [Venturia canescens]|uniref:synergin gamma-like n=1 Tax=Venturia canescens TaxID=32260 RepID=UPI001C9C5E28|nr:synergin gamma-like [Venturia canescens]XP_043282900.1 synergin gamma-like [Venturia canescens]
MNKTRGVANKRVSQLPSWLWSNSNVLPTLYRRIWECVKEEGPHLGASQTELLVDTKKVFPLLLTSQLPTEVLGYIWGLANQKYAGKLTEQELYVVLALIAVAQTSYPFTNLQVLHLLPGPPEPRLNLSLIHTTLSLPPTLVASNQDALQRRDDCATKHEVQGRSVHRSSIASCGTISIPGIVPNLSDPGEIQSDSNTQISRLPSPMTEVTLESRKAATTSQLDGKTIITQACSSSDMNDEFSDFQSAAPSQQAPQSIPMWDSKQGSAIGSRLANHNLGVKKLSEKPKRVLSTGYSSTNKTNSGSRSIHLAPEKMIFTPVSRELLPNIERLGDIFSKCALKNQAKTVILKDTAIRNNDPLRLTSELQDSAPVVKIETPSISTRSIPGKTGLSAPPRESANLAQDLMNHQVEDKYSALRVLVEKPNLVESSRSSVVIEPNGATGTLSQSDDFGDFVSAEQPEPDIEVFSSLNLPMSASSTSSPYNTSDFSIDFERFKTTNGVKKQSETPPDSEAIRQIFGSLDIEPNRDVYFTEEKNEATVKAEKITSKEDTISVNSIELVNGSNEAIITRSNSVPSLDLKSFLSPCIDDEQQQHQVEDMHQLIYSEWKQYMESCVLLLQTTANVFSGITSEVVLHEVLTSAHGYNFLCNLAEVAAVCRRVNFSHKEMNINIMGFDDILMDIDKIWAEMEPFYANIPIVTELPVWPLHQNESSTCCALCLTVVTSGRIVYNDNNYHVTCANLWLNCVNHNLPTLRYPPSSSLLLHSVPIASAGNSQI